MNDSNVPMEVTRADGRIEFDSATDGYTILVERVRASLRGLSQMHPRFTHSRHVIGLLVSAPAVTANGKLNMDPTALSCTNSEIAGALWFGGMLTLKKHDPAAFEVLRRRMRDAGL